MLTALVPALIAIALFVATLRLSPASAQPAARKG